MAQIIVLGAGMVGSAMAIDLAAQHQVMLTDISQNALDKASRRCDKLETQILDVMQVARLQELIKPYDLVVCAVPGFMGFATLQAIIEAKKDVVVWVCNHE